LRLQPQSALRVFSLFEVCNTKRPQTSSMLRNCSPRAFSGGAVARRSEEHRNRICAVLLVDNRYGSYTRPSAPYGQEFF